MPCSRSFPVHPINAMEVDADTNSSDTAVKAVAMDFLTKKAYAPPSWASHIKSIPSHTCSIGQFPTPIHKWNLPNLPPNTEVWLKRDDLSGMQVGGNKVRKLEFLMADAVANGADCVITIGSIQSNHCCATAVAAKYLNLDCYLILSTPKVLLDKNPGLTGNLLVDCLVGARVVFAAREECAKVGGMYPEPFTSKVRIGEAYQAEVPDWTPLSEVETDDGDCSVAVVLDPSPSDCAGPPPQMASENGIASRKRKLEMVESPGIKSLVSDEIEVPP